MRRRRCRPESAAHALTSTGALAGPAAEHTQTNVLGRYTRDEFLENSPTTIGVEFLTKAGAGLGAHTPSRVTTVSARQTH